jgi:hypothetical protein
MWVLVLLAVVAPLLLTACGKKRPPAVTTHPPARTTPSPGPTQEPWPTGPDVRPVDEPSTSGEDFSVSDASGEGGPLADIHIRAPTRGNRRLDQLLGIGGRQRIAFAQPQQLG